jgi:hypothetical protein
VTLGGTLAVANGGTGSTSASTARTALGVAIGTDVQAYDPGLQSIAGLTTVADRMIYTTASDTYAVTTLTAFGRSLMDDADATAARATLGSVIGTDVQAYDAGLQSISGLTTAADRTIYTTASDTYAVTTLTAFGRSLMDDADAAAGRTTLGLGTMATQSSGAVAITGGTVAAGTLTGDVAAARIAVALNAAGSAPIYACRAWVLFNGTGTPAIAASGNVSSITDNGTGNYTVNFTTAMPDASYAVTGSVTASFGGSSLGTTSQAVGGATMSTSYSGGAFDPSLVAVAIFR